jgi:hypothetical protein
MVAAEQDAGIGRVGTEMKAEGCKRWFEVSAPHTWIPVKREVVEVALVKQKRDVAGHVVHRLSRKPLNVQQCCDNLCTPNGRRAGVGKQTGVTRVPLEEHG